MLGLISFFTVISVLQITVLGDLTKINDVKACIEFCSASSSVGSFKDGQCTCENLDNKDAQNVLREVRQVEHVDPTLYTKDLTDEERPARCALGSRNHLRHHDADRVVKYFVNDGPSRGHSYFVGVANTNDDTEKGCRTEDDPSTNSYQSSDDSDNPRLPEQAPEMIEDNYHLPDYNSYRTDYRDALVGTPYDPYNPVYLAPMAVNPYEPVVRSTYDPLLGSTNYILRPPVHSVRPSARDRLLGAKLPRRTIRPRLGTLRHLSNTLLGLVRQPVNEGLLGASSILHSLTNPDPTIYSSPYFNELSTIGRSTAENVITKADPIVGNNNENAQTAGVDSGSASESNTQESFDTKKSVKSVQPIQRANIPAGNYQNIPYSSQYFMPLYPPQNHPGVFFNSMPGAYILQPVSLTPEATRSAQPWDTTAMPKPQDSSNCGNDTSSDSEDSSTNSVNETTEEPKQNTNTTNSAITKRDSNGEKTLKSKSKTK